MRCDRHPPARTARTRASRCGLRPSHSSAPRAGRQPLAGRAPPLGGIVPPGVAIARKRGGAPLRRPASLYFGITRVRNRSLPGRLNVWTRIWRSLPRPVPMLISENVGECARPRCYRVSVARTTGPDPAISSVFTGLASLVGRFDGSDGGCLLRLFPVRSPLFRRPPVCGKRSVSTGGRHKRAPRAGWLGTLAMLRVGRCYSASARAFLATSATSAKVCSSL